MHQKACCQNAEVFIDSCWDLQSVLVFELLRTSSSWFHFFPPNDSLSLSLCDLFSSFSPLFLSPSNIGGVSYLNPGGLHSVWLRYKVLGLFCAPHLNRKNWVNSTYCNRYKFHSLAFILLRYKGTNLILFLGQFVTEAWLFAQSRQWNFGIRMPSL